MKTTKYALAALALIVLAMPGRCRANSFTFTWNGNTQQGTVLSFLLGTIGGPPPKPTINQLTIETPLTDPLVPILTGVAGSVIPNQTLILDSFNTVNGVPTLVGTLEFDNALVVSVVKSVTASQPITPIAIVKFDYQTETTTVVGGGPGPTPTPEPSSLLLLGTGLLCCAGTTWRKKLFA